MNFPTVQIQRLVQQASGTPFLHRRLIHSKRNRIKDPASFHREIPIMSLEELVGEKMRSRNAYSSRLSVDRKPVVTFQLEYDTESAIYLGLDRVDLKTYAEALRRCWSLLGLRKGDRAAIFDYGTSPLSYLVSSAYTPYLSSGAADTLGCQPVCNDGVSNMSGRAVEILKFFRPRVLFMRRDCLPPFTLEVEHRLSKLSDYTRALVVSDNESIAPREELKGYEKRLGVPIYRLLRIDAAMFLAAECPKCHLLHSWRDLYFVENLGTGDPSGKALVITNCFARTCPTLRYLSQVDGSLEPSGCSKGPRDIRIAA